MKMHSKMMTMLQAAGVMAAVLFLNACSPESAQNGAGTDASAGAADSKVVRVAYTNYYYPYDFVNEEGKEDGYEVAVMKEIAKTMPEYKFEFHPTSDDDLLLGVQSGKYDVGIKGVWRTAAREQRYLFTENPIGASEVGMVIREEDKDRYNSMESFARDKGRLIPIAPQDARYMVIDTYNKAHPDNTIALRASETFVIADAYTYLLEKRYDAYLEPRLSYEANIEKDNAPYAKFRDRLNYTSYKAIATYPLINKNQPRLLEPFDKAITQLKADGTLSRLEIEYLGYEVSKMVNN